jgi:hypothetical protein
MNTRVAHLRPAMQCLPIVLLMGVDGRGRFRLAGGEAVARAAKAQGRG